MDTQSIEILGRNRLINELIGAGIEVAQPIRDRGIDLIAYMDRNVETKKFTAVPIQMKAASSRSFTIDKKYAKTSNLIIAFVWGVQDPKYSGIFALTYKEIEKIAEEMGWTKTASWRKGVYSTTAPGKKLVGLLNRHKMTRGDWVKKLEEALT